MEVKARNKWNGRSYIVRGMEGREVTLEREDGSMFKIDRSEFSFSYILMENA
jgi:hypothetical protein